MRPCLCPITLALAAASALAPATVLGQSATTPQVEVIGTAPLAGLGVDRNLLPYASQTVRRNALDQAQGDTLTDFLARRMPGMQVNDIQGSPLQSDLTYRGHRASALLGASQGLSVYLDGVRINEPFGDVVNWDMVPEFALQSLTVLPGANPSFGLNTLGGAIVLQTQDGRSAEGQRAELGFGSHGRQRAEVGLGQRHGDGWHSWVGGTVFREHGWRDHSPGRQALVLAKLGRSLNDTDWSLALLGGRATLVGNGLLPSLRLAAGQATPDLYAASRSAVYSHPDRTANRLGQATANWSQQLSPDRRLQALAYWRDSRRDSINGDVADAIEAAEPAINAALNTTATRQSAWGLGLSLAQRSGAHQWQLGAALDASRVRYRQLVQAGSFTASRGVLAGAGAAALSASVTGRSGHLGVYATDTWRLAPLTHFTGTLRYNRSRVGNTLTTRDDDTGLLEAKPAESFIYTSLNPALGITWQPGGAVTVFGNVARNARVPTVIELGCADPSEPCRLPAGLQSDPYLKQVRATSLEAGLRWRPVNSAWRQRLELALYRSDNHDDIVFGSVSATSQLGYFQNFKRTRHQGLDVSWQADLGSVAVSTAYSLLHATYQASGVLRMGGRNVAITPGIRMAGLPRHNAKLSADWGLGAGLSLGSDVQLVSSRGVQGNEDGLQQDGDAVRRVLKVPGHGLLHLRLQWQVTAATTLVVRMQNALNRRYETYGALAETVFDAQGRMTGNGGNDGDGGAALFVAPGAPRSLFLGLRLQF